MMLSGKVGLSEKQKNDVTNQTTKNQMNLQMNDKSAKKNAEAVIPKEKVQDTYTMSNDMKRFKEDLERQLESSENEKDAFMELAKVMEIARRIAHGDKVPPKDEKKLMEYSSKLYFAAKSAATMIENNKPKRYKSLYEDEEKQGEALEEGAESAEIEESPEEEIVEESVQEIE